MQKLTCVNHKLQIVITEKLKKQKKKHHWGKSPFERNSNANRKTFYQSQVKKNQQREDHFLKTDTLPKDLKILIIHPKIYSCGME